MSSAISTSPALPPQHIVKAVLATPDLDFPVLLGINSAPSFAPDGHFPTEPGYDSATQTLYAPAPGFSVPAVPDNPTPDQIKEARALICDDLLGDFPFVGPADKANAVAILLFAFLRNLIDGATPLHLVNKPTPGTGATLLVWALTYPGLGRDLPSMTEGNSEDEWRKRITSILKNAPLYVLIDNLMARLESAALASAITARKWTDRNLGSSQMLELPVGCCWVATANNPAVSAEIARRTTDIRLDAKQDRPWLREKFRHPDLRGWVIENRGAIVAAALTLIRAWIVAGKPPGKKTTGMFESWSKVIGGVLDTAGIEGFLTNADDFYDAADSESATWRGFVAAWWTQHASTDVLTSDLLPIASGEACLALGSGGEQSQKVKLGQMLAKQRDRVFAVEVNGAPIRLRIDPAGTRARALLWRLQEIA